MYICSLFANVKTLNENGYYSNNKTVKCLILYLHNHLY